MKCKNGYLWRQLATNNELGLRMLYALDKAQILSLLTEKAKSYKYLYKPEKIFFNNTNLMHACAVRWMSATCVRRSSKTS